MMVKLSTLKVRDKEFKKYIRLLLKNGYKVYAPKYTDRMADGKPLGIGWVKIGKGDKVGSVSYRKYEGFSFSTSHKPSRQVGTGYGVHSRIWNPTLKHAEDTLVNHPAWAKRTDIQHINKYKDIEDYVSHTQNKWAKYRKVTL